MIPKKQEGPKITSQVRRNMAALSCVARAPRSRSGRGERHPPPPKSPKWPSRASRRPAPAPRIAATISARRAVPRLKLPSRVPRRGFFGKICRRDFLRQISPDSAARSYRIIPPEPTERAGSWSGVSRWSLVLKRGIRTGEARGVGVRGQSIRTRAV
jgi:hypothetical protein